VAQPLLTVPSAGRWKKLLVRLGASALVLAVVLSVVDLEQAKEGFARLSLEPWLVALATWLGLHALSALKWRFLLGLAGAHIPARHALTCHAAGLFANLCLPSLIGGDVLRAGLALKATDRKTALVVGSVVDRVADLTALLSVATFGFATAPWAQERLGGAATLPLAAALIACGALGSWAALRFLLARVRRLPRKLGKRLVEVARALDTMRRSPGRAVAGWCACLVIQTGFVLVNVYLGEAIGLDLELSLWLVLWPLAKIAAMLPVSFGGLGVREAAFAALVSPFGPEALAVAQSLVWQSVLIVGGLLCGGFWMVSPAAPAQEDAVS